MITKSISTEHGIVTSNTEVTRLDNGQVLLYIVSMLGDTMHKHLVTIGSEDGADNLANMSEADLFVMVQKHLDEKRAEASQVLAGRARVAKISGNLV